MVWPLGRECQGWYYFRRTSHQAHYLVLLTTCIVNNLAHKSLWLRWQGIVWKGKRCVCSYGKFTSFSVLLFLKPSCPEINFKLELWFVLNSYCRFTGVDAWVPGNEHLIFYFNFAIYQSCFEWDICSLFFHYYWFHAVEKKQNLLYPKTLIVYWCITLRNLKAIQRIKCIESCMWRYWLSMATKC